MADSAGEAPPASTGVADGTACAPTLQGPFVVVLTGGPCAGKSSAMAILRDRLSVRGLQVLTVPENATHFLTNSEGFQPEWAGKPEQVAMQRVFLDYQIAQEDAFKTFGRLHPNKSSVLLLDSCTLNSKVYLADDQWEQVLRFPGRPEFTEEQLLARYDLVIHMQTCAFDGHYEWGPGSNNPGRYHSPEQARETDLRGLQVFDKHPQLRVVPHSPSFDGKIAKVLDFVNDALHVEGLTGGRRRRLVSVTDSKALAEVLISASTQCYAISSYFVDEQMQHSVRRRAKISKSMWMKRFEHHNQPLTLEQEAADYRTGQDELFERRAQACCLQDPSKSYMTRRVISKDAYFTALEAMPAQAASTTKYVLSFVDAGSYYELLFFPGGDEDAVLDYGEDKAPPAWLRVTEAAALTPKTATSAVPPDGFLPPPQTRPHRALKRHTTEEAAHRRATKRQRLEGDARLASVAGDRGG